MSKLYRIYQYRKLENGKLLLLYNYHRYGTLKQMLNICKRNSHRYIQYIGEA